MNKNWSPRIENYIDRNFELKVQEQILDELAGIIYSELCQLSLDLTFDSFNAENNFLQRTGTDA